MSLLGVRRSDQRSRLRLVRQHRGSQAHPTADIPPSLVELVGDGALGGGRQLGMAHQLAHEITVSFLGGHAPGRGMRLAQITRIRQVYHHIAHRGRADIQVIALDQVIRTDGLGRLDEIVHDQGQDQFLTFTQSGHAAPII